MAELACRKVFICRERHRGKKVRVMRWGWAGAAADPGAAAGALERGEPGVSGAGQEPPDSSV